MERILVLGATGNIGSAVLKFLQGKDVEVFASVQSEKDFSKVEQFNANPVIVDFLDQNSLNSALVGIDRAFLVTPIMQKPELVTEMFISAAKENGLKHIVRSTAAGADSKGAIQLSRWAGASEDLIKQSGLNYTIIRPYTFLQNFINFHSQAIKHTSSFYLPVGNAKTSYVDVNNVGEVIALSLTSDKFYGATIELSGLEYTHEEIATILSRVLNKKVSFIDVDEATARKGMLDSHMPEWLVDALMELNFATKQGWLGGYSAEFKKLTGKEYTPAENFFTKNLAAFA